MLPEIDGEKTVYLVAEYESDEDGWQVLSECWEEIFENELSGWHTDERAWPKGRTFEMFKAWFVIEMHSVVEDLCTGPVVDDKA
jgi:hypothetical protein